MRKLYEIDNDIFDCFDAETGEILDENKLNELQMEKDQKIEGVGLAIKELKTFVEAWKEEKRNISNKIARAERQIEGYKHWISEATDGKKFQTSKVTISYRRSEEVQIQDEKLVPFEYMSTKITNTPDKNAIKQALRNGVMVDGCELVMKENVQVK